MSESVIASGRPEGVPPEPVAPAAPTNRVNYIVFVGSLVGVLIVAGWALVASEQAAEILGVAVTWASGWCTPKTSRKRRKRSRANNGRRRMCSHRNCLSASVSCQVRRRHTVFLR